MPVRDLEWYGGPARGPRQPGANGIDGVVSTALGVAAGTPTVALVGDIAFVHDAGALTALRRAAADLRIVVVDNDGGGIFSFLPQATSSPKRFEQLFGTPHGTDVVALAAAHGLDAATVTTAAALVDRMTQSGPVGHPHPHRPPRERPVHDEPPRRRRRRPGSMRASIARSGGALAGDADRAMADQGRRASAWNLAWVSASSARGSLSATMPPPAHRRARRRSGESSAQRIATAHVPLPAASTQPTAPP